ncbi:MAG: iron ABC transporter permease [Desulfobacter sp.]|nr:iron ABC transporter permease [Desulfobacter sp.]
MDGTYALMRSSPYTHPYFIAGLVPGVFFALLYFYPLSGIFAKSFFPKGSIDFSFLNQVSPRMMKIIWFTFWQAAVSTGLTLAFALPCAFVMSHYTFRGKTLLRLIASIPFVLPAVVVGAALDACFGQKGMILCLNQPLTLIFIAHVFYNFSVMLRILTGFWTSLGTDLQEAAACLGAKPAQVFFHITLPLLRPAIWAGAILVFIFCFSSFGIILILGGPSYSTIESEIYRQAAHIFNLPLASFLSLIQILFTFGLMAMYTKFSKKAALLTPKTGPSGLKPARTCLEKAMVWGMALFILLLCLAPLLSLALRSLIHEGQFSLIYYRTIFENTTCSIFYIPPFKAIQFSFVFAAVALVIAMVTGICAALFVYHCDQKPKHKIVAFFDPIFMLPLSTSAVTLGFGIIITLDRPPLNLRTSVFLIPLVHALVGFPFVLRAILPALRSISPQIREAAALLGASPIQVLRFIDLPLMTRALVAAAVFAFTISLGEFGATIFTASPDTPTIPLAIYRFLGQPGALNYGQAMAISTILMIVTAAGYILIENFRGQNAQGI